METFRKLQQIHLEQAHLKHPLYCSQVGLSLWEVTTKLGDTRLAKEEPTLLCIKNPCLQPQKTQGLNVAQVDIF